MRKITMALVVFFALGAANAAAGDFQGRCVRVLSGDTIQVAKGPRILTVRLAGMVAPKAGQPYGNAARDALERAVLGRQVDVAEQVTERGGLIHAVVTLPHEIDATPVNIEMVGQGLAWSDPRGNLVKGIEGVERQARNARAGLWSRPHPVPPWQWRPPVEKPAPVDVAIKPIVPLEGDGYDRLNMRLPGQSYDGQLLQNVLNARALWDWQASNREFNEFVAPYLSYYDPLSSLNPWWYDNYGPFGFNNFGYEVPGDGSSIYFEYPYWH